MGRYGGFELSYGSDADVMFVHEPVEGAEAQAASSFATAVVSELRRLQQIRAEFIDNLSHELRTPITTVGLLVESLGRDVDGRLRPRRLLALGLGRDALGGRPGIHYTEFALFQHATPRTLPVLPLARELGRFLRYVYPLFRVAAA